MIKKNIYLCYEAAPNLAKAVSNLVVSGVLEKNAMAMPIFNRRSSRYVYKPKLLYARSNRKTAAMDCGYRNRLPYGMAYIGSNYAIYHFCIGFDICNAGEREQKEIKLPKILSEAA